MDTPQEAPEILSKLSEQDIQLISPELQELQRLDHARKEVQDRLARMLMLREPTYLRDPEVQFDMEKMAFVKIAAPQDG